MNARALLAAGLVLFSAGLSPAVENKTVPTAEVMLYFKRSNQSTSGGCLVGTTLTVKDGQQQNLDGRIGDPGKEIYGFRGKCRIVELKPGDYGVRVRYAIYIDASKKKVAFDRVLIFLPESRDPNGEIITPDPEGNGWICVDRNIYTAAYFVDPNAPASRD